MKVSASNPGSASALRRRFSLMLGAVTAGALACAAGPAHAVTYTFQNIIDPLSGAGTTVGFSITGGVTSGFAQTAGTFTTVNQPGTAFNQLLGINQSGTVAAGYSSADPAGATLQKALTVGGGPSFASPTFTDI